MGSVVLRTAAQWWTISDPLEHADAIIILGGNISVRSAAAADLYKQGMAPLVAVGVSRLDHGREADLNRQMLMNFGVPANAIVDFTFGPHNTYGEARGVLNWAGVNGARKVIVPVEIFQTRRVRWIFNRELVPAQIRPMIQAITPPSYSPENWWLRKEGLMNFRKEVIKLLYYHLRY
jgi:uncharacterized SAM-binding protein YcdF (DUF218 family)